MKNIYFTPGPSQLFPSVKLHINQAFDDEIGSLLHRSKKFEEIFTSTINHLRILMNIPKEYCIVFLSSGTEAMERIIENCVEKESFHFTNGSFSNRFYSIAEQLKKSPKKKEAKFGNGFDFSAVTIPKSSELICITHNETSSGVMLPIDKINMLKKNHPTKLLALDVVSSAPYPNLDFTNLDCVFFSVQKCFGLPPGISVLIISPQALEKSRYLHKKGANIGSYHNFETLFSYSIKNQTSETPPTLHIYLLDKIANEMVQYGIENIRKEIDMKAMLFYNFLDAHKKWRAFVTDPQFRSSTVIVMQSDNETHLLKKYLERQHMIVGQGYGKYKDSQLRIANFPVITLKNMKNLIEMIASYK